MSVEKTKIYPINTGWVVLDHAVYLFNKGTPGKKVDIPNICFYVDTGEHKLMIDTGLPDAERATQYHHDCTRAWMSACASTCVRCASPRGRAKS